jgi:hypothetical protein
MRRQAAARFIVGGLLLGGPLAGVGLSIARPAAADAPTSIVAITDDPDAYEGTVVTIVGTVAQQRVDWRGESVYSLDQGGRRITIVSTDVSPLVGARLQVSGEVFVHPEGNSEIEWPPVLLESSRTAAP